MVQLPSVLWRDPEHRIIVQPTATLLSDLNLERIFAEIAGRGSSPSVDRLLRAPLLHSEDVEYRRAVFEDLSSPTLRTPLESFSRAIGEIRRRLTELSMVDHPILRCRGRLDVLNTYCRTVSALDQSLDGIAPESHGLKSWRDFLKTYVDRAEFQGLVSQCAQTLAELGRIRYSMRIEDRRIVLDEAGGAPDYTATVENLLEPFLDGWTPAEPDSIPWSTSVHPVEERVLDELAQMFPLPFGRMMKHADSGSEFVDPVIERVADELQFYFSYLRLVDRLSALGLEFCLPEVTDSFEGIRVQGAYDLALAVKRADEGILPVTNDYRLTDNERIIVVTGPNQGGKSTFARMFGQVAYFAALGCPVPARQARVMLTDGISTHFERPEHSSDAAGRLQSELSAIGQTLEHATERTIIILNESFSSTASVDARQIGEKVLRRISERKSIAVFVTFIDELSRLDGIVSMVAGIGGDPTLRTFKLERKPADGRAYAAALADRFDLSYETIVGRVTR
ncbi:DNA mismatch repair protein MutS [Nocardia sp. NPDC059240]|uniref:MutS-related protein n=1 Tax=Nocardia sp. NPDC059240 TaxID=3346786 RepID=UPI0036A445BF